MSFLKRTIERVFIAVLSVVFIWLAVTQVFDRLDQRMPVFLAALCTYILAAYILLPRIIRFALMVLRRGHIPCFTHARDGLLADPVNIIIIGSEKQLYTAFTNIAWYKSDPLTFKNSWRMIQALLGNKEYNQAPFSSQYLFGRHHDIGFQQPIGISPVQRHHVRFWAVNIDPTVSLTDVGYWLKKHLVDLSKPVMWVGAATKDVGIGLKQLTYQFTHRVDRYVDEEREYILQLLRATGVVANEEYVEPGKFLRNKYVSDGKIVVVTLSD